MARTSLAFQRLRFCIFTAGVWVCSLVGELRPPHAVWYGQKKKKILIMPTIQPPLTSLTAYEPVFDLVSQTSQAFPTSEPLFMHFLVLEMLFLMAFLLTLVFILKIAA